MDLFDLVATLSLDSSDYDKGIRDSKSSANELGNEFDRSGNKSTSWGSKIKTAAKVGATAIAAVSAATVAFGAALTKSVNGVADYGDKVDKMSQKIGISYESYQKWDYVMQRAGTSVDNLKMGMKTLSQQAEKNSSAFQELGISQEEVANLSQEELFERTIKGLADMESGTKRTALASQLLGRAGADMAPLLNQGSEAIEEQMEIAERYGMIMPEQTVKASAAFKDSVTTMQMTMTGLKNRALGEFLPAFTQVTDGLALMFAGDLKGIKDVEKGIHGIVQTLDKTMPELLEAGGKILETIVMAIIKNLPKMATAAVNIITKLIEFLSKNMATIVKSAVMVLEALVTGIAKNLPVLIPAVVDAILTIVDALVNNIDLLIEAAGKLIVGLAKGLVEAIPVLVEKAPQIIKSLAKALLKGTSSLLSAGKSLMKKFSKGLKDAFKGIPDKVKEWVGKIPEAIVDGVGDLWEIGKNIIDGLWQGISDAFDGLWDWLTGTIEAIPDLFKSLLGIASPSKVFKELGKWIPEGLAVGIEGNMDAVQDASDAMADATAFVPEDQDISVSATGGGGYGVEINVYATPQQDERQIAEMVQRQFVLWEKQRRAAFV